MPGRLRRRHLAASVRDVNERPEQTAEATLSPHAVTPTTERVAIDLDRIERDLAGVETALQRLDAGTYWTDEVTGDPISDEALLADPVARRAS